MSYLGDMAACRHFWVHLAKSELRSRFRYSRLGILWALVHPLMTTLLYTLIFGSIFKRPALQFATFVYSGLITWELLHSAVLSGSISLLSAETYIRQRRLPYAIYPLRTSLAIMVLFFIAFCGLAVWALCYQPATFGWSWISLPGTFVLLFLLIWPVAIIAAFLHTKFRDFQQVMVVLLQAVYFLSPVFLDPGMFKAGNLTALVDYNPVAHVLNLVRAPLIHGEFPTAADYGYSSGGIVAAGLLAWWKIWREEPTLIFYF